MITPHGTNQSPWNNNSGSINRNGAHVGNQNSFNLNDHLNTVRQMGSNGGVISPASGPKSINFSQTNSNSLTTPQSTGVMPLNSQRVTNTNKNKLIDSKLSSLRHEQDSTAASANHHRFPMSADDAFKLFGPYMWEVEKREVFEF